MSEAMHPSSRAGLIDADAEARILAQTCFERPLVLEAGAGTGKTTALVSRIVVWTLGEGWRRAAERLRLTDSPEKPALDRIAAQTLQRVVAMTFTDAAAAEMARRVGETLSKIAAGATLEELAGRDGLHPPALPPEADVRRGRARALVGALDRLVVRTIHAFSRRLLAAHPVEAGLHPAFEVDGEGRAAAEVVREILELRLRDAYGDPGDPVLLALAARGVSASTLEETLLDLVQSSTSPSLLREDPFDEGRINAFRCALRDPLERLCTLAGPGTTGNGKTKVAAELVELAGEACNRLGAPCEGGVAGVVSLQAIAGEPLEPRLGLLKKWAKGDFTASERKAVGDETVVALIPLAASLHEQLRSLCELDAARLDLGRRALAPLLAEITEALRLRGLIGYEALLQRAAALLSENPAVAARERAQMDQLLVDEFQDTDDRQCATVAALALDGPPDQRPGLFLVGDPKQSIYGWRGADLGAYDAFVARVRMSGGHHRTLSVNYRSVQPVLDEVERVMAPVMHAAPGLQPQFQPLVARREGDGGFCAAARAPVEYWVSRELRETGAGGTRKLEATLLEARALARDVAQLVSEQGVAPRDIGVLLRGFGEVEEYLSALRDAGVPYAVARDRSYYRRREVIDASCLVRCVVDPGDALAFVALLRSSAVGVPDAALLPLWREKLPSLVARLPDDDASALAEIREAVTRAAAALPTDVPGIERVAGWEHGLLFALEALCALRRSFHADPSDVFVERLRTLLAFEASEAARPLGAFRLANLARFFRELDAALAEGADPTAVLRHLRRSAREELDAEEARPLEAAEQAVQVMSIHKAKGLGFAHTYVVQLHKEPGGARGGSSPPRVIDTDHGVELLLFGARSLGFRALETRESERSVAEDVRTLYVAMTRAKDRLVLAGLWPEPGSKTTVAKSHVALLGQRTAGVPAFEVVLAELRGSEGQDRVSRNDALWVFPGLVPREETAPDEDGRDSRGPAASEREALAAADAVQIAAARGAAATQMRRRFGGPASAVAHEAARERFEARRDAEPADGARSDAFAPGHGPDGRAIGTAVGTAVHRALEVLDLEGDPEQALAEAEVALGATLSAQLDGGALDAARARATDVLERFRSAGLYERLRALAPHVIARELPVLLPPGGDAEGPVAYIAGAVDLVYLDPATGEPVVADYKTDPARSEGELARLAARYAAQGAIYVRAVQGALGLPRAPRFELWFLDAGRVDPSG